MALATRPNLVRWYTADAEQGFPRPYDDCRLTPMPTYAGEQTWFYMNLLTPFDTGSSVSAVSLVHETTSTATSVPVQTLYTDELPGDKMTVYGVLQCPVVSDGFYRWKITIDGVILLSSRLEVMSESQAKAESIRVQYRNATTIQGIRFAWLDEDVDYLTARIPAVLLNPEITTEDANYTEVTTGAVRAYNAGSQRMLKFKTNYVDDWLYEGLTTALRCDTVLLNGTPVVRSGAVERSPTGRGALAPATFNVYDLTYAEPMVP